MCDTQADKLGSNECATLVMAMLEAVSDAHENLSKVLELMPKLLQSVSGRTPASVFRRMLVLTKRIVARRRRKRGRSRSQKLVTAKA